MLLLIPIGLFLTYILPILLFVRVRALSQRLDEANARLDRIERALTREVAPTPVPPRTVEAPRPAALPIAPPPASTATKDAIPEPPPPRPVSAATDAAPAQTIEGEIGGRWMLIIGTVVLVMGIAFFVKYSFDRHWITESARVAIGTAIGIGLWLGGVRLATDGYALYGRIVAGGGLAMVYVAAFAASALYGIVPAAAAFAWMALVSGITVVTADRQRSVGLALFAILLAFLAPFLVGSTADAHLTLFAYDALLAAAALALVQRHGWPILGPAAFWFTWMSFASWSAASYRADMFVSTELYLTLVCAIYLAMLVMYQRAATPAAERAALVLAIGPVLYHLASVSVLFDHSVWLLVYLIVVTAVGIALAPERPTVRLVLWIAVAVPLLTWVESHTSRSWYAATLATGVAIYLLHLAAQLRVTGSAERTPAPELTLFHANGLGIFAFTYLAVSAQLGSTAGLAFLLAAANGVLAFGCRHDRPALMPHALALAFAFTATAVALQLSGPWITIAWAAEGAAVIWVGLATRRTFLRLGGTMLLAIATARLVSLQFAFTSADFMPIWNSRFASGAFIVALIYSVGALYRRYGEPASGVPTVAANVLTVGLLTADIYSYWLAREPGLQADFARELTISLTWAAYGMGLIALGFSRGSATLRYLALALFGLTIVKLFTIDLLELGGIYRIAGFVVLGVLLLVASFLYQQFQARLTSAPDRASPESTST